MTRHSGFRVALASCLMVGLWDTSLAVQEAPATKTHTWLATLTSPGADTAAFKALADRAAVTDAARLTAGQDVILRWDGATKGEAQRITAIRPIASPTDATRKPGGRGPFAMRAEFVAVDSARRTITFRVPMTPESLETLGGFADGQWLQVVSTVDGKGTATAIASLRRMPLPRTAAQ